jgi:hypothetical protein
MTLVSQAEYGRRLGVSRASISQWKKAGRLVLQGEQVDVEASDAKLKRFRHAGLPEINTENQSVKRGRPSVKQKDPLNNQSANLTFNEIAHRLQALDWQQSFQWSDEARADRARLAAECIGWEAVESQQRDDGHHGGFQLRIKGAETCNSIAAGYGFELSAEEVLYECRDEILPSPHDDDGEDLYTVRLDLLHVLAKPFFDFEKPPIN